MSKKELIEAMLYSMSEVFDPEIPVNIVDLGLIYNVELSDEGFAHVEMTLTSPTCPAQDELKEGVIRAAKRVPGVEDADIEIVWSPTWTPETHMTELGKKQMRMMGFQIN